MIKLSVSETEWSSLLARTGALILYISIWIFVFGPEKLPGLLRNGPQDRVICFWQGIIMHWKLNTRAPNDVFLLNTLKSLFRLSRVLLDLDRCILSDARTSVLFSPNFRCNLTNYENENFFSPLFIAFLNPKTCAKNSLTWAVKVVKCEKLEFRKSYGIYCISFENCTWMEWSCKKF